MLIGAHAIIYSKDPEADRAFLRDVLALPNVDLGRGWLIFGLPPSEVAVHPTEGEGSHELYLMCADIERFIATLRERGVEVTEARDLSWGRLSELSLPGGGKLGVYQPRHARPKPAQTARATRAKPRAKKGKSRGRAPAKTKTPRARKARPNRSRRGRTR